MKNFEQSAEVVKCLAHISKQMVNFKNSTCLKCAVQLGIPDIIHKYGKPITVSQLAYALPINPSKAPHIQRLMRVLVRAGFFAFEKETEAYTLTPAGRLLVEDEELNVTAMLLMFLDPGMLNPWNYLNDWFRNDDPSPFYTGNKKSFWDYGAEDPRLVKVFNEAMAGDSRMVTKVLVDDCKFVFDGLRTLVDVGGGTGTVAKGIAKKFPDIKCSVLDLPHVVADVGGDEKLNFLGGDMLENIPQADAVLLKSILHDWNDEDCLKILKNCKKSIPKREDSGKVIIIDVVMGTSMELDDDSMEAQIAMDIQMLVIFSAKERTEKEFAALFSLAGFSGYKLFPIFGTRCLIEVYP